MVIWKKIIYIGKLSVIILYRERPSPLNVEEDENNQRADKNGVQEKRIVLIVIVTSLC